MWLSRTFPLLEGRKKGQGMKSKMGANDAGPSKRSPQTVLRGPKALVDASAHKETILSHVYTAKRSMFLIQIKHEVVYVQHSSSHASFGTGSSLAQSSMLPSG